MKTENEIKNEWLRLDKKVFKEIEMILQNFAYDEQVMVGSFVAALCGVDYADLFTESKKQYNTHARWLYWYSLRYMSGETYERISVRTYFDGCKFSSQNIGIGISKMTKMIALESEWRKKWRIVKHLIDLKKDPNSYHQNDFTNEMPQKYKLSLNVPKGMKKNVEIEVKEEK